MDNDISKRIELYKAVREFDEVMDLLIDVVTDGRAHGACVQYADMTVVGLQERGYKSARMAVGRALWRVGTGELDCVHHIPELGGQASDGNFAYHAWVVCDGYIIDPTVRHLRKKLEVANNAAGEVPKDTNMTWSDDLLVMPIDAVPDIVSVVNSKEQGSFYQEIPGYAHAMCNDTTTQR